MTGTADPKLIHLVGRLLQSQQREDGETNHKSISSLVQQLCHQHREYQRKNITQLTRDVQFAVTHWQQREANISNQNMSTVKAKKRKHLAPPISTTLAVDDNASDDDENDDRPNKSNSNIDNENEEEYDRAAIIYDSMVSASTSVSGNSLNDRLLQIRNVKKISKLESTDAPKKSSFRIDVIDSQDEISEPFADEDHSNSNRTRTIATENTLQNDPPDMDAQTKDTEKRTSKNSSNRKRKLVRRNSRADGDSNGATLGPEGPTSTSLSFTRPVVRPTERYCDLGGMDHIITTIRQLVEYPITRPELYRHLGVDPPRGVLLRGPPGTYVTNREIMEFGLYMFYTKQIFLLIILFRFLGVKLT